jgi:hypothetical protein
MRRFMLILAGIVVSGACGCESGFQWPNLASWTRIPRVQRDKAAYWDPYPKNDMQDISMSDTRPRDFDRPMSEVKRAQLSPYAPLSVGH